MEPAIKQTISTMTDRHQASRLLGVGLYSARQAATYTGISAQDIRRWLFGYRRSGMDYPPLWQTQLTDQEEQVIGFHDLLEIRFVHAFRQHHVSLPAIRAASAHAREIFQQSYPFTCRQFQTDGRNIFATVLEETGDEALLDLVHKQYVFRQIIAPSLYEGIEYAEDGQAERWYPLKRNHAVVLDPERNFGKPVLTDSGVDTEALFLAFEAEGQDAREIARMFEVSLPEVEAAIRFERSLLSEVSAG